jgi:PST family polysaccharide transporter
LTGFVFSLLINSIVNIIIYVIYFHWTKIIRLKELFVFKATSGTTLKNILKLGIASLIAETINQGTILLIRSLIVKGYGVDINGVYQCVVSLSNNYFLLFYMSISAYVLPVLSEIKDIDRLNEQINEIYRFTLFIVVPIITFTFVLREIVILLLYTSKFMQASNLVVYNFTGDFFKALAWVLGAWLIPRSKFKLWMIIAILFNVYFFSIFALLTFYFKMDIISAVIAYAISNFMHFVVNLYFIKKYNNFRFKIDSFKLMLYSGIFVLIILLISSYKTSLGYFFIIPFFLLWMKLSIKKEEFMKLLSLIKIKY